MSTLLKRFLSMAIVLVMVISMVPAQVFATETDSTVIETGNPDADPLAEGDGINTEDELVTAMAAGGTVTLSGDITVSSGTTFPEGVTVDLNGNTLTFAGDMMYVGGATLTNGKIVLLPDDQANEGYFCVAEGKLLTLKGLTIEGEGYDSYAVIRLYNDSDVTITDCVFNLKNAEYKGSIINAETQTQNDITMSGVEINGENIGRGFVFGYINMTDCEVTLIGTTEGGLEHGFNGCDLTVTDSDITITGGTGRGITLGRGYSSNLTVNGESNISITEMKEATILMSQANDTLSVAETASVTVDAEITNNNNATVSGTVTVSTAEDPAGSSAENPIYIEFTMNAGYTEGTASVTVPVGTVYYASYGVGGMELSINDGEPTLLEGNPRVAAVFSITNDGEAAAEYSLKVSYPEGTMSNPAALVIGENTASVAANSQGYFYTWTAEKSGALTITMPEGDWSYVINNLTAGKYGDTQWSDSDPVVNPATVVVSAGDNIQIVVNSYNPDDMWSTPAADITFTAEFAGDSAENPIYIEFTMNAGYTEGTASVTVPVGTVYYASYGVGGMELSINDGEPTLLEGNPRVAAVFSITNDGEAAAEYSLKVSYPKGTMSNPATLVIGENTAAIEAGNNQGYYFTWTAEYNGVLTVTMPEGDWMYVVNNLTTSKYGDTQWSDVEGSDTYTAAVAAGDKIQIVVNSYDPADMWNNPAANITFTAAFEAELPVAEVTKEEPIVLAAEEYQWWDGSLHSGDVELPLNVVMNFKAKETAEEVAGSYYAGWYTDFYLTITGLENGSIVADDCYLAGNYGDFGWIVIPTDGVELENGVEYPIVSGYDAHLTYTEICKDVQDFIAAIYVAPAILDANPNFKVTLSLKMVNPDDSTDVLKVGESYTYDIDDLADPVAKIGDEAYATLARAVAAANDGDVITMVADHNVTAPVVIEKDVTIDLNGKTITTADDVTVYPIIRIQGGANVTVENGSIINKNDYTFVLGSSDVATAGNLTIKSGTYYGQITLASVTKGKLVIEGGNFSIMPYYDPSYGDFNYNFMFNCYDSSYRAGEAAIEIKGGSFKNFNPADNAAEGMNTNFLAEGYKVVKTNAVTYTVEGIYVAEVNGVKYVTLAGAVAAAEDGGTVTLLNDATGAGVVIDKDVTIDFAGYTYSFNKGVGSTGTTTNGFQILSGNIVTLMNGTLNVAEEAKDEFYILVQNYANLTVQDMTLDGTNLDKYSGTDGDSYTLSNNSGNVAITGATNIIANDEGDLAYAFDVCKYGSYEAPVVTVDTTGTITGNVEVSEEINDNLTITSGTYTVDVTEWCDDGLAANYDEFAGMYIVGDAPGTESNPIALEWYWNDEQTVAYAYPAGIPAGETMYYSTTVNSVELTIDGEVYGMLNGNWYVPEIITIENDSEEDMWPVLMIAYPAGSWSNPAELVIGSNIATGSNQGYLFNWTAPADGKLIITMPDGNWQYNVNNLTSFAYGERQTSTEGLKTYTMEVSAGDEIQLNVNTFDPDSPYGDAPAGTVTFTAAFEKEAVAVIGDARYATVKEALEAAVSGDTVTLVADSDERGKTLVINENITLDLQNYTLTAKGLVGLSGSKINAVHESAKEVGGRLKISENGLILSETPGTYEGTKILPVWVADEGCYVFSKVIITTTATGYGLVFKEVDGKTVMSFGFKHSATGYVNQNLLNNGATDNRLSVVIRLEWTTDTGVAHQDFVYKDEQVGNVAGGNMYTMDLYGYESLEVDLNTLRVSAMMISESGAVVYGTNWEVDENGIPVPVE